MSADDGNHNGWYRAPTGGADPVEWPAIRPQDAQEVASYPARWSQEAGGPPLFYRADTLTAAATAADPGTVHRLNEQLAALDLSLTPTAGGTEPGMVTFRLVASHGTPDALRARDHLRAGKDGDSATDAAIDTLAVHRLYFVGMVAKEGHAGSAREAVTVLNTAPPRCAPGQEPGGRRPVIALIDSGIGYHPWLSANQPDPFWVSAQSLGWPGVAGPATNEGTGDLTPADGTLDTHAGHGTFIAGLIRQIAPDATVLSIPLMLGNGVLEPEPALDALAWLLDRVRGAATDASKFVDIVCLSFGYYERSASDEKQTARLRELLGELGNLGVRVVVSAGNHQSSVAPYPAAFADPAAFTHAPPTRLISVGALNPDGSSAKYSNFGPWVSVKAPGTALISLSPPFGHAAADRTAEYNPANLFGGFARWSGTSFAAAVLSGRLARALCDQAGGTALRDVSPEAAHRRAELAYQDVHPTAQVVTAA